MHNRNVDLIHLLLGTPLFSFCKKQNYSAFTSYLCALLLSETYNSPLLGQVISSISAEHGSSHLECCVRFRFPHHKKDNGADWNESSVRLLGWLKRWWAMERDWESYSFLLSGREEVVVGVLLLPHVWRPSNHLHWPWWERSGVLRAGSCGLICASTTWSFNLDLVCKRGSKRDVEMLPPSQLPFCCHCFGEFVSCSTKCTCMLKCRVELCKWKTVRKHQWMQTTSSVICVMQWGISSPVLACSTQLLRWTHQWDVLSQESVHFRWQGPSSVAPDETAQAGRVGQQEIIAKTGRASKGPHAIHDQNSPFCTAAILWQQQNLSAAHRSFLFSSS